MWVECGTADQGVLTVFSFFFFVYRSRILILVKDNEISSIRFSHIKIRIIVLIQPLKILETNAIHIFGPTYVEENSDMLRDTNYTRSLFDTKRYLHIYCWLNDSLIIPRYPCIFRMSLKIYLDIYLAMLGLSLNTPVS